MSVAITGTEPPPALSSQLRTSTRAQHTRAERSRFIDALTSGAATIPAYADLLAQYHLVYEALEVSADLGVGPLDPVLVHPGLRRLPALEHDLAVLSGPDWRRRVRPLPATERYVRRISELRPWIGGYVAHAYTRYLGDLSGGQVVRRALIQHYPIPSHALRFYDFPLVGKPKPFKDSFRAAMDAAPFGPDEQERVVAEACFAFDLNTAVFDELAAAHTAPAR